MVWFEILPSLFLTAAPLLVVGTPVFIIGNWYFLNGKVRRTFAILKIHRSYFALGTWTKKYDQR